MGVRVQLPLRIPPPTLYHYDGHSWRPVQVPGEPGHRLDLISVNAISSHDVWAAGVQASTTDLINHPLVMHFDGSSWKQVPFPQTTSGQSLTWVYNVSSNGPGAVYAMTNAGLFPNQGDTFVARWDGKKWLLLPQPTAANGGTIQNIGATSSREAWAVGNASDKAGNSAGARAWHWVDGRWVLTVPDQRYGGVIYGIDARDARHVWVSGRAGADTSGAQDKLYLAQWNGFRWSTEFSWPSTTADSLWSVRRICGRVFSVGGNSATVAVQN